MEKIGFDLNSCQCIFLDSEKEMYNICDKLAQKLSEKGFFVKPLVIPYFYGIIRMDDGISCIGIFRERTSLSFFTLHTFSKRKVVYFDLCSQKHFDKIMLRNFLQETFQANEVLEETQYDGTKTWGIQLYTSIKIQQKVTFDDLCFLTNKIISKINMTKISNSIIEKTNNSLITITLIAESHIALIYNSKTNEMFVDIFSCKFFNENIVKNILEKFCGCKIECILKSRGLKHFNISDE